MSLTRGQEALWFLWQLDPTDPTYHLSAAWRAKGPIDEERLKRAWGLVVARHQTLHSTYGVREGLLEREELAQVPVDFRVMTGEPMDLEGEAARRFDLEHGPVTRIALWRSPEGDVVQFTLHHIACDGLSMRVLAVDLQRAWAGEPLGPTVRSWAQHVAHQTQGAPGSPDATILQAEPGWVDRQTLDPQLVQRVRATAKALGVTQAALLQAAFRAWLFRLTGERRVAVPMAGRTRAEWEVVGYFSEAREVPVDFEASTTVRALVHATAHATTAARRRSPAARAFDGLFNVLPSFAPLALDGLALEPVPLPARARVQGFGLTVMEWGDTLALEWACARPQWSPWAAQWTQCFPVLLEGLCRDPDCAVAALPLATEAQAAAVQRFGDGGDAQPGEVLALLEAHARATPDLLAVDGPETLTWAQLMAQSRQLAPLFAGLPEGGVVSLCVERSPTAIALMVAALQARQGYGFPGDGDPLLHRPSAVVRVRQGPGPLVDRLVVERRDAAEVLLSKQPVGFAVMTSGTSQEPRSVRVGRAAFERYVRHFERSMRLSERDRMLQFHALSFDGHVEEVFPVLAAGGVVVLRDALPDARALVDLVARRGITAMSLPTGYWAWLASQARAHGLGLPPSLRLMVVGGEAATAGALEAWRAVAPYAHFVNTYGPSEACVAVTFSEDLSLGRPIPGATVAVRGAGGELVPAGVVGEVFISGDCLALGVESPFATRDLARWLPDGRLEFHGRADQQLKVQGRRLEPRVVEQVLEAAGASRAHVALHAGFLSAWVLGRPPVAELRRRLTTLPMYARPTRFAFLERFPLTAHGKVDVTALQALPLAPLPGGERRTLNPREAAVAQVFAAVLGLPYVGADDDFFALGGDSLKALECSLKLEHALGFAISLADLYQAPTPEGLARREAEAASPWLKDQHLLDDLPAHVPGPRPRPQRVFFTGATGFVGVHVLAEWLNRVGGRALCLVRGRDEAEARSRLGWSAAEHKLELPMDRVDVVAGDLTRLPKLPADVDAVVHVAAVTNLKRTYEELRPVNVLAVAQVLRLGVPTHLISSASAVGDALGLPPSMPYGRSKWVGERLAERARAAGLAVWVHRPGRVWGSRAVGTTPASDALFAAVLAGRVTLEAALTMVTPVDLLAAEVVGRALDSPPGLYESSAVAPVDPAPYQRALDRARQQRLSL